MKGNYAPLNFNLYVYYPGRRIVGFHIILDPRCIYRVGVLESVVRVFSSRRIPILHFITTKSAEGNVYADFFVDLSTAEHVDIGTLILGLKAAPHVLDVKLVEPLFDGFVFSYNYFPLMAFGERAIILPKRDYEGFIKLSRQKLGSGFNTILYIVGYDVGVNAFKKGHSPIAKDDVKKLIKVCQAFFQHVGFGVLKIEKLDLEKLEAIVKVYNCFECELFKGADRLQSHFVRGVLAGWFSQLFKKDVTAIEIACIAKGDPYCLFKLNPK